jgi:hypothetical protein
MKGMTHHSLRGEVLPPFLDHAAAGRRRWLDAEPQERQGRLEHDRARQLERRDDDKREEEEGLEIPSARAFAKMSATTARG